ncbi:MAG: hypothetical protein RLZ51_1893 [Pseudomonadota bacterium]|jgi:hypothetical protein
MEGFDWYRYAVGGAASRPDSFSRLNPDYAARVAQLIAAADQELGPRALTITSAYRSPELQAQLYEAAVAKYGSPEAARKWVAPPGRSQHNIGMAVDFADASGRLLRDPNSREAQWIAANAARFGLDVPMSWEPWQVELLGGRGGAMPPGSGVTMSTSGGQPMGLLDFNMQPEQPMTLRDRLRSPEAMDGLLTWVNSMRMSPDPNIGAMVKARADRREVKDAVNRTASWLQTLGTPQAIQAAQYMAATGDAGGAVKMALDKPGKPNVFEVNGKLVSEDGTVVYDGGPDQKEAFGSELDLLKVYRGEKDVQSFQGVRDYYERMRSAYETTEASPEAAGAGDIAIVYSYMKMLDPGSTVMQGEYANAQNAGGVDQAVVSVYNSILNGDKLTPEQRRNFLRQADGIYSRVAKNVGTVNQTYGDLARRYGVNPGFMISPPAYQPYGAATSASTVVPYTVINP